MTIHIETNAIQGPPFHCPECASEGTRTSFGGRGALGSHRFSAHSVTGTSTGSAAYKSGKLKHGQIKRTYIKRTSTKRAYNKKPQSNPLLDMVNNPGATVLEIHAAIADKVLAIETLRRQISELNTQVNILEKFQDMLNATTSVADEPRFAVSA